MNIRFPHGLLPTLFAVIALLLAVQQASATPHLSDSSVTMVHIDQHPQGDPSDLHATGCCSVSVGTAAAAFYGVGYSSDRAAFEFDTGSIAPYQSLRSKQYRPPRLV